MLACSLHMLLARHLACWTSVSFCLRYYYLQAAEVGVYRRAEVDFQDTPPPQYALR